MHFTLLNLITRPLPRSVIVLTVYCLGFPSRFFLFDKQRLQLVHASDDSRPEKQPISNDSQMVQLKSRIYTKEVARAKLQSFSPWVICPLTHKHVPSWIRREDIATPNVNLISAFSWVTSDHLCLCSLEWFLSAQKAFSVPGFLGLQ